MVLINFRGTQIRGHLSVPQDTWAVVFSRMELDLAVDQLIKHETNCSMISATPHMIGIQCITKFIDTFIKFPGSTLIHLYMKYNSTKILLCRNSSTKCIESFPWFYPVCTCNLEVSILFASCHLGLFKFQYYQLHCDTHLAWIEIR